MIWLLLTIFLALAVRVGMPFLIDFLEKKSVLDMPNERSSHTIPTPRGGGWLAVGLPVACLSIAVIFLPVANPIMISLTSLATALVLLIGVSALDDKRSLGPLVRLFVQFTAAAIVVFTLPESVRVFPILGIWAEKTVLLLGFVWMINLTNFIDGINGITIVNGLAIATGFLISALFLINDGGSIVFALSAALIIGGLIGFIPWNVPQARIFMGDVGSIPLGLWQAYGLSFVAAFFGLIPALLMCLYPLLDATITLLKRAFRRKRIWEAHREHYYQQAAQNGRTHARTSTLILGFNALSLGLAIISMLYPRLEYFCLALGLGIFAILITRFQKSLTKDYMP